MVRIFWPEVRSINDAVAPVAGSGVVGLFQDKDPNREYYAKAGFAFVEYATPIKIYRKSKIPTLMGGRFFDKRVARVTHISANPLYPRMNSVDVILYGKNPIVSTDEVIAAFRGTQRSLAERLHGPEREGLLDELS